MKVTLPYGRKGLTCEIPNATVLSAHVQGTGAPGADLVRAAMEQPIGSPRLAQLAEGKKTATIIISDHTRPVPSKDIIPSMLQQLREGNPDIQITLLVATGCHRGTTREELVSKLGEEIVEKENIVVHDAFDASSTVNIGVLPSGAPLVINRVAVETDLLVSEGFIEPHFFAGFSGGRKSILPGVCDRKTVLGNHCGAFIHSPNARTGMIEGNPIHRDMEAAAEMAKLQFIVNVVIDAKKQTVAAFAGDFRQAHAAGVEFLRQHCQVKAVPGDVVITTNGGAPLDQNLYQCVKGLTAAEASAKDGATLILCAEMADGIGGEGFYQSLKACEDPAELYRQYSETPQSETIADQWQTQILCRILAKYRVILVTRPEMEDVLREMKLEYAPSLEEALSRTNGGDITVIPDGVSVVVLP